MSEKPDRKKRTSSREPKARDFGFDPQASPHHFLVRVHGQSVSIVERFGYAQDDADEVSENVKVTLTRYLWDRIREPAAAEFNRRLQMEGERKAAFSPKETLLAPHFGKELTLLAWAVEDADADPTPLPSMIANWNGLAPEERWWFFTTISASAPGSEPPPRERGWRKAIKIAFAENPVHVSAVLRSQQTSGLEATRRQLRAMAEDERTAGQLDLWQDGERE